jgi:tetratricopeptide (TPR) repeat protein
MMELHTKMKEAEVYCSMGLFAEALEVYDKILSQPSGLEARDRKILQEKVSGVKEQIEKLEKANGQVISGDEISKIKKTLLGSGNVQAVLDGAFALKELGHYKEAITEYGRLLQLDYPPAKIVPEIAGCLARFESAEEAMVEVERLLEAPKLGKKEKGRIQFRIGFEIEKRGDKDLARCLYQNARKIDPEDKEIDARLEALDLGISAEIRESPPDSEEDSTGNPDEPMEKLEKRRENRIMTRVPEFVYVEFSHGMSRRDEKTFRLNVVDYSAHGIGLLVSEKDKELTKWLKSGDQLKDITFYASWALIKVDTRVRHVTKIEEGLYQGMHVIGVEAEELITNAQP